MMIQLKWLLSANSSDILRDLDGFQIYLLYHDDVIKWKHFSHYWLFVRGIHQSLVNSPHKGHWRRVMIFFIFTWTNVWVNNGDVGDLRHHHTHYNITVIIFKPFGVEAWIFWAENIIITTGADASAQYWWVTENESIFLCFLNINQASKVCLLQVLLRNWFVIVAYDWKK